MGKENTSRRKKTLQELNLCDDFLFAEVISDKEICIMLLEKILDIKIRDIEYLHHHETMEVVFGAHAIEMDIYVADDENRVFNVEMQASNQYNVPKRSRYYHSIVDSDQLLAKNVDYNCLKNNYVIFICTFDPIGKGLPRYSFRMKCEEDNGIDLDDGSYTVILNSSYVRKDDEDESGTETYNIEIDSELAAFLRYIENSTTEVANETDSVLMQKIHRKVQEVKKNKEVGVKYMKFQDMMKKEYNTGKNEGFELKDKLFELLESEGRLEEYAQSVKDKDLFEKLLQEHGLN